MRRLRHFAFAREGASAVEYAVLLSLIALVVFGSVRLVGEATEDRICSPMDSLSSAGVENVEGCP